MLNLSLLTPAELEWHRLVTSGFHPVFTRSHSNLCGLHALKHSLIVVLRHFYPSVPLPHILAGPASDVTALLEVVNSPCYRYYQRVKAHLPLRGATVSYDPGWNREERKELKKKHFSGTGNKFWSKDLKLLIRFLNRQFKTADGGPVFPQPMELCIAYATPRKRELLLVVDTKALERGGLPVWVHHFGLKIGRFNEGHWEGVGKEGRNGFGAWDWKRHLRRLDRKIEVPDCQACAAPGL